jgi:hypothetical protein
MSYTLEQNGYIERDNRIIAKVAHNMLDVKGLPLYLWGKTIHIIVYLLNKTSLTCLGDKTSYEIWHGAKPIISHYQVLGYFASIHQ